MMRKFSFWQIVFLLLLCTIPFFWFIGRGGVLINGLDTNFPLDPLVWFGRRFFVWNDTVNAGNNFSSSVSGLFFHLIQVVPFSLGFGLQFTEIFSLVFWFSAVVFSSFLFAKEFIPRSKIAQLVFVLVYSLNIYLFNTWENVKVANLALVVSLPLFLAILHSYYKGKIDLKRLFLFSVLASIASSGAGINPAYFITLLAGIAIYVLVYSLTEWKLTKRVLLGISVVFLVLILLNLFWILPLSNFMFFSAKVQNLAAIGFTDWLSSLSENTSLLNVIRLQGAWDWYVKTEAGFPLYIPYALNYLYRLPFLIFSFILPALSFISLAVRSNNSEDKPTYNVLAIYLILGLFLGAGLHEPTGKLYGLFVNHLPLFSFFRSPWYIFTPLTVLAIAGLASLLFSTFEEKFSNRELFFKLKGRGILTFSFLIFLLGYLFYSYPLITGKIFRPGRSDGFYVKFPEYLWKTRDWLNQNNNGGRVVSYPDDDLESFKWGYRGTESVLGLLSPRELIVPSFNFSNSDFASLLKTFYLHLKSGSYKSAISLMPFMGISTLLVKNDSQSLAPNIVSSEIEKYLYKNTIGEWDLYTSKDNNLQNKIFIGKLFYTNLSDFDSFLGTASLLDNNSLIVKKGDTEVARISNPNIKNLYLGEGQNIAPTNNVVATRQSYRLLIPKNSEYFLVLQRDNLSKSEISYWLDKIKMENIPISETDSLIVAGPLAILAGEHLVEIDYPEPKNLIQIDDFSSYSFASDLRNDELPSDIKKTMLLYNNQNEEKKISIPIREFNPFLKYKFSFDYKYFYGSVPYLDILQYSPTTPIKVIPTYAGSSTDWLHQSVFINPAPVISKMELNIRLLQNKYAGRSKAFIENLSFRQIHDNKLFFLEKSPDSVAPGVPDIKYTKISPVEYQVEVRNIKEGYALAFLENYSPNWKLSGEGTSMGKPIHFSIDGYANGWYVAPTSSNHKLRIYYQPQDYFKVGALVSIGTITFSLLVILRSWLKYMKINGK